MPACPIFGEHRESPINVLPTYGDVIRHYLYEHDVFLNSACVGRATSAATAVVSEKVAHHIMSIWEKASLPTLTKRSVIRKVTGCYNDYRNLMKPYKGRKDEKSYQARLEKYKSKTIGQLFDICSCWCEVLSKCSCNVHTKVPVKEHAFLLDQRSIRKMLIGSVDVKETKRIQERKRRKDVERLKAEKEASMPMQEGFYNKDNQNESHQHSDNTNDDFTNSTNTPADGETPAAIENASKKVYVGQMRTRLPAFARACDRHAVSDRAASALASALLDDLGIVTETETKNVIDRSKVRRERIRNREILQECQDIEINGLFFDGRKDKSLTIKKGTDGRFRKVTVKEEHISLIEEPGSHYLGHITPASGSSRSIVDSILSYTDSHNISTANLHAIGCDGTNVNTGWKKGVIRLIEETLQMPMQWLVCQLHANELLLRHLFEHMDGKTSGPNAFTGPIGKALQTCEANAITYFEPIGEVIQCNARDLSTDQAYLLQICSAVSSGVCSPELSAKDPGKMSHSRWVTAANRILRLYVTLDSPSKDLKDLALFVMNVYAPMWFSIKSKPSCKDGSHHVWETIMRSRYLSPSLKKIIDPVIQRNAYFGHSENILLRMITDERRHIRELGLRRVLKCRQNKVHNAQQPRVFKIPILNFSASDYVDLIDWSEGVSEPPVTRGITTDSLKDLVNEGGIDRVAFPRYPCHTQAVERHVKLVTKASLSVCGQKSRDGLIRSCLESRNLMPVFNTKAQYKKKK